MSKPIALKRYTGVYKYISTKNPKHIGYRYNYKVDGQLRWETAGWNYEGVTPSDAYAQCMERIASLKGWHSPNTTISVKVAPNV